MPLRKVQSGVVACLLLTMVTAGCFVFDSVTTKQTKQALVEAPEVFKKAKEMGHAVVLHDARVTEVGFWGQSVGYYGRTVFSFLNGDSLVTLNDSDAKFDLTTLPPGNYSLVGGSINVSMSNGQSTSRITGRFSPLKMTTPDGQKTSIDFTAHAGQLIVLDGIEVVPDTKEDSTKVSLYQIEQRELETIIPLAQVEGFIVGRASFRLAPIDTLSVVKYAADRVAMRRNKPENVTLDKPNQSRTNPCC